MKKQAITKNYSIVVPSAKGNRTVTLRQTSTLHHAVKHAAYIAQLQFAVEVYDNRLTGESGIRVKVFELPAIDDAHKERAKNKRDKRYRKLARRAVRAN